MSLTHAGRGAALLIVAGACAGISSGALRSAAVIAKVGDVIEPGVTISTLNSPFTTGNGKVGFTGNLSPSNNFVWFDTTLAFRASEALPTVLTGAEGTMGISDSGNFIYSPSAGGEDAVFTKDVGVLLRGTDPAPGFPGLFNTFNSRPTMIPDGTSYWMAGTAATSGGATSNRVFYKATAAGAITPVFAGGDSFGGFTLSTTASNFDYHVADSGLHHIHIVDTTEATAADEFIYLDGAMPYREGSPTGQGDNWATFDIVSVNNAGNHIFTGDTSGAAATDEFVAYNGSIAVREGDTLDGLQIASGATLRAASINNLNQVVHMWGWGTGVTAVEALWAGDGSTLGASSLLLLQTGDTVDVNGDTSPDFTVTDFNASTVIGPGLDLGDDGFVYLSVDLTPLAGGAAMDAIIRLQIPAPGAGALLGLAGLAAMRRKRR